MISIDGLIKLKDELVSASILANDQEIAYYKIGSLTNGEKLRNKIDYLDLYKQNITDLININSQGLNYLDYGISDKNVTNLIGHSNELLYNLFK